MIKDYNKHKTKKKTLIYSISIPRHGAFGQNLAKRLPLKTHRVCRSDYNVSIQWCDNQLDEALLRVIQTEDLIVSMDNIKNNFVFDRFLIDWFCPKNCILWLNDETFIPFLQDMTMDDIKPYIKHNVLDYKKIIHAGNCLIEPRLFFLSDSMKVWCLAVLPIHDKLNFTYLKDLPLPAAFIDNKKNIVFANKSWLNLFQNHKADHLIANILKTQTCHVCERTFEWSLSHVAGRGSLAIGHEIIQNSIDIKDYDQALLHMCCHDLKEPLRTISNFTQLLTQNSKLDQNLRKYTDIVLNNASHMKNLIENLLKYAQSGKTGCEYVDLNEVLQETLDLLASRIYMTKPILNICGKLPKIWGDRTQIIQLFQNILDNALKFNDKEKAIITISYEENPDSFTFCIQDNGMGVESEYIGDLFLMFKRLHTKQEKAGSGIGLALCKKIVNNHNGRIWIESIREKETRVFFDLPKDRGNIACVA